MQITYVVQANGWKMQSYTAGDLWLAGECIHTLLGLNLIQARGPLDNSGESNSISCCSAFREYFMAVTFCFINMGKDYLHKRALTSNFLYSGGTAGGLPKMCCHSVYWLCKTHLHWSINMSLKLHSRSTTKQKYTCAKAKKQGGQDKMCSVL